VITVHAGTYRNCINLPRGGESDAKSIVYQASQGEKVENKDSEIMNNWVKVQDDVLKVALSSKTRQAAHQKPDAVPYGTLQPPQGIKPAQTRGWFPWDPKGVKFPAQTWTPEERQMYEARVKWFHEAKYGLMFHFLAFGERSQAGRKGFRPTEADWTSERWNQVVDDVDVEKVADQAQELGVGYVILTLGQNHKYACAPNPVIDELWGLKSGQYNARRDLPMELGHALAKRDISLMLYIVAGGHRLPNPAGWTDADFHKNWLKVVRWYSNHYGTLCKGWWVDGLGTRDPNHKEVKWRQDYCGSFVHALRHGNPDTIVTSAIYGISDVIHGHCINVDWDKQHTIVKPFFGRWDPDSKIQWHVLQYLGSYWGAIDTPKQTADLVAYGVDVVRGGGVFTFDVGCYNLVNGKTVPCLEIPPQQMAQLRAVRDAIKSIPPSDGSGVAEQ
ncbi:hypothetical protein LCGC14_2479730, partial [marine sediment metagenome]